VTVFWKVVDPDAPGYPWSAPALHPVNFPTPGMFVDLDKRVPYVELQDNELDGIVRAALLSAAIFTKMSEDHVLAKTSASRRLRKAYREALVGGRWHRVLYGVTNPNWCGGSDPAQPGAQHDGKADHALVDRVGLCLEPRHACNRDRLAQGQRALRTVLPGGTPTPGATGRCKPLLYMPAMDLAAFREGKLVPATTWPNGQTSFEPPPAIFDRGVQDPLALTPSF
jgi:hypothetical protein